MFKKKFIFVDSDQFVDLGRSTGQILVEALVGITLLVLGAGVGALLIFSGSNVYSDRFYTFHARIFAEEGVWAASSILRRDWDAISDGSHGLQRVGNTWQFSGTSDVSGELVRFVTVSSLDSYRKELRVKVSWGASSDRSLFVEVPTLVTRWEEVVESGGGPGSGEGSLSGDWSNPQTISSEDVDPSGRKGADLSLFGDYAYVATTRTGNSASFTVFDVGNPYDPQDLGEYNTGDDLTSVMAASGYAYVSSIANNKEFLVLDVSSPSSVSEAGSLNLSGTEDGLTVFFDGTHVYLGRQVGAAVDEFVVLNISNPSSPSVLGSYDVGASVRDIHVLGNTAYLATDVLGEELLLLDVSTPSTPSRIGSFAASGGGDEGAGRGVFAQSVTRVFLGTSRRIYMLNAATPSQIVSYGFFSTGADVNDIVSVGKYAFLATSNSNSELYVLDVSNPSSIVQVGAFNYPQDGVGIDYEDNFVYAAVRSNDVLRIIGPGD